ncbi:bile acid:sodium symporter family protein [Ketobacter sp.]|uniref:bile acid:sodium symporter family protein n=1 Tax=Ketobacter sp. TaxID=2083498 RepID=UPI000F1300AC|nr:bile acid:sodium symporter family protein [Ketobacter sp.]RLT95071.1 MAG: bile acid:sodium symporter family protein [Ketobacter sp.]
MEQDVVGTYLVPAVLAVMMVGMGMTLQAADFRRLLAYPKAVVTGLCAQVLLLPALGWLIVTALQLPPEFAVGVMIISFCPGGVGSNLLALIARADTALSVTLTGISNLLLILSLPWWVNLSLRTFLPGEQAILLPVGKTILSTALITVVPILIGMWVRHLAGAVAQRAENGFRIFSGLFLGVLMLSIAIKNRDVIIEALWSLGPAIVALNLGSMLMGLVLASLLQLRMSQRTTIAIETGFQNAALAILVTTTFLQNPRMALAPVFYGGVMFVGAFALIGLLRATRMAPSKRHADVKL